MKEIVHEIVHGVVTLCFMGGFLFLLYTSLIEGNKRDDKK
jgi:hypothetical protein